MLYYGLYFSHLIQEPILKQRILKFYEFLNQYDCFWQKKIVSVVPEFVIGWAEIGTDYVWYFWKVYHLLKLKMRSCQSKKIHDRELNA